MNAIYNYDESSASKNSNASRAASTFANNLSIRHSKVIRKLIKRDYFIVDRFGHPTPCEYNIQFASEIALKKRERATVEYFATWANPKNPFKCHVKVETIAKAVGLKVRATQNILSKLEAMGVIKRVMRGRLHKTNLYALEPQGLIRLALGMIAVVKSERKTARKTAPSHDTKLHPIKELITYEQKNKFIYTLPISEKPVEGGVKKFILQIKPAVKLFEKAHNRKVSSREVEETVKEAIHLGRKPEDLIQSATMIAETPILTFRVAGQGQHSFKRLLHTESIKKAQYAKTHELKSFLKAKTGWEGVGLLGASLQYSEEKRVDPCAVLPYILGEESPSVDTIKEWAADRYGEQVYDYFGWKK